MVKKIKTNKKEIKRKDNFKGTLKKSFKNKTKKELNKIKELKSKKGLKRLRGLKSKKGLKIKGKQTIKKGGVIPFISHIDNPFEVNRINENTYNTFSNTFIEKYGNKPLNDFFIYSSHNTEVETGQFFGNTSMNYIKCGFLEDHSFTVSSNDSITNNDNSSKNVSLISPLRMGGCLELDIQYIQKEEGKEEYYVGHVSKKNEAMPLSDVFAKISEYNGVLPLIVNIDVTQLKFRLKNKTINYKGFDNVLKTSNLKNRLNSQTLHFVNGTLRPYLNEIEAPKNVLIRWTYKIPKVSQQKKKKPKEKKIKKKQISPIIQQTEQNRIINLSNSTNSTMGESMSESTNSNSSDQISELEFENDEDKENGEGEVFFEKFENIFKRLEGTNFNEPQNKNTFTSSSIYTKSLTTNHSPLQNSLIQINKKNVSKTFKYSKNIIEEIITFRNENPNNINRTYPEGVKSYYWGDLLLLGVNLIAINFQNYDLDNLAYQSFFLRSHYIPIPEQLKAEHNSNTDFELYKSNLINKNKNVIISSIINENVDDYIIKNYFFQNESTCPYFTGDLSILNLFVIKKKKSYFGIINLSNINEIVKNNNTNTVKLNNIKLYEYKKKNQFLNITDQCILKEKITSGFLRQKIEKNYETLNISITLEFTGFNQEIKTMQNDFTNETATNEGYSSNMPENENENENENGIEIESEV
jgi:hypothetical protein